MLVGNKRNKYNAVNKLISFYTAGFPSDKKGIRVKFEGSKIAHSLPGCVNDCREVDAEASAVEQCRTPTYYISRVWSERL